MHLETESFADINIIKFLLIGSRLAVVRQSSGSFQAIVWQSSGTRQIVKSIIVVIYF